jgi:outer membrane protein assembly factor BamB
MNRRLLGVAVLLGLSLPAPAPADDWPQWQGPDRTNVSKETGLLKNWPPGGPKLLWTFDQCGVGYSGPAVVGDRLYTLGQRGREEYLICLDTATGKEVWAKPVAEPFENDFGSGPRSTPTVDGDAVVVECPHGEVVCLDARTGARRWGASLTELGGRVPNWGYSESPLVDGDKVVVTPGGDRGVLAALNKRTGEVLWRSRDLTPPVAYASPVVARIGGVRQYVQMTAEGPVGVAAEDGKPLWHINVATNTTAVVPTPVVRGDLVYVTSDYGAGCALLRITARNGSFTPEVVYKKPKIDNHHGGVVLLGEHLYGWSGNTNSRGSWVCQEFKSGKVVWQEESRLGAGSVTAADGQVYCYGQKDGSLVRIEASPNGWREAGRFRIPRETRQPREMGQIWTHPVIANGKLFLRDLDLLFCYDLKDAGTRR